MFTHRKFERGQALAEYHVLIPIGIAILVVAGLIVGFLTDSFQQTADGLEPEPYECNQDDSNDEDNEGPRKATMSCYSVELISDVYDPETNTTTVGYRVTSGCSPDISHWTLAIPSSVSSKIQSASEDYTIGYDPRTGLTGVKFDTGYESASVADIFLVSSNHNTRREEVRDVFLTMGGYFQWDYTDLGVKTAGDTYTSVISAPSAPAEYDDSNTCEAEE